MMSDWGQEFARAVRRLLASPTFSVPTVISLAVGIGLVSTILAVKRALLTEPMRVAAPNELYRLCWVSAEGSRGVNQINSSGGRDPQSGTPYETNFSYAAFQDLKEASRHVGLGEVAAFTFLRQLNVSGQGRALRVGGMLVSGEYFAVVRPGMTLGRGLDVSDDREGSTPVAVLSQSLWRRLYGEDSSVLGRSLTINGQGFTIVGVTGPGYFGMSQGGFFPPSDVTLPLRAQAAIQPQWAKAGSLFSQDATFWLQLVARFRGSDDPVRFERAMSEGFRRHLLTVGVQKPTSPDIRLLGGARGIDAPRRRLEAPVRLLSLIAIVSLVLACLNASALALLRNMALRDQHWLRLALGASRTRLLRETALEYFLLSTVAGAIGLVGGSWARSAFVSALSQKDTYAVDMSTDLPFLLTAAAIIGVATTVFGAIPLFGLTWRSAKPTALRLPREISSRRLSRGAPVLMALQLSLTIPLLICAGLLIRTVHNLTTVSLGFEPDNLVVFKLDPTPNQYVAERVRRLFSETLTHLQAIGHVQSVSLTDNGLLTGSPSIARLTVDGKDAGSIAFSRVGPNFFSTVGVPILRGRDIGIQDAMATPRVAVLSESAVQKFFAGREPLGSRVRLQTTTGADWFDIVGVVRDVRTVNLRIAPQPHIAIPMFQTMDLRAVFFVLRTDGTGAVAQQIVTATAGIDSHVPVEDLRTERSLVNESISTERMVRTSLLSLGVFALFLACLGIFAIAAFNARTRKREVAVRVALGAPPRHVLWLALRWAVLATAAGLIGGLACSFLATRSVTSLLFGVAPADPVTVVASSTLLCGIAMAAALTPAWLAAKASPMAVLHDDRW